MYQETPAQKRRAKNTKPQTAETKAVAPEISYTVSMSKPWTHLLEVEMRLNWAQMPAKAELKMPVWTPGSYLVREYARHVQDFNATDASGNNLMWEKINKNTWQIDTKGAREIVAKYKVYANELTVRTNELNDEHAFFNNAALLMFPKDQLKASSTVKVVPYGNWKVATGLPKVENQTNVFRAENFDVLYDSPFEVSDFKEINFDVQGKSHRYVVTGEGNYDLKKMAADTEKIVNEAYKVFGELPYNDYTFIVNLRGGGGLEHMNSTALQWNRFGFTPKSRYTAFLNLVAHEFFHLWNVKRIRPDALGPFDYENENYTKLLWVAEGATAYYEGILLRRAGLISEKEFWDSRATLFQQLQDRPGRFETSVEDASFDAWIKYYRPDENAINNQISYYDKGEIVNMMLDVTIRTASNGAKSLDDVIRYLYDEFYKKGKNYTPEDYQKISEMMAGKSLDDFFSKYVRGTEEIDYDAIFQGIGVRLKADANNTNKSYIGANLAEEDGKLMVRSIPADTPAYEQGLNTGDQIVAVDGNRASQTFLTNYIGDKKPGDKVKLTVFRFDQLRDIEFTLGNNIRKSYSIVPIENPSDAQRTLYRNYLQAELK
ncbi:MAG TPA: PDZ domain-containing protein [Pyrinomonadaceae bacterium]|jgi:predicted metalloprotease with PDZ domain